MTKSELRQKMKEHRNNLPKEEQLRYWEEIQRRLTGMELWSASTELFTYLSFGSEVDTWRFVKEALSGRINSPKAVYVPRVEGKEMFFYQITGTSILKLSKFGVPEPDGSNLAPYTVRKEEPKLSQRGISQNGSVSDPTHTTANPGPKLMIVPGLAFDPYGNRIGYGAGYYDRFLTEAAGDHFIKVALAYDFQLLEKVPAEEHDIRMDYIVTPGSLIICHSEPAYLPG